MSYYCAVICSCSTPMDFATAALSKYSRHAVIWSSSFNSNTATRSNCTALPIHTKRSVRSVKTVLPTDAIVLTPQFRYSIMGASLSISADISSWPLYTLSLPTHSVHSASADIRDRIVSLSGNCRSPPPQAARNSCTTCSFVLLIESSFQKDRLPFVSQESAYDADLCFDDILRCGRRFERAVRLGWVGEHLLQGGTTDDGFGPRLRPCLALVRRPLEDPIGERVHNRQRHVDAIPDEFLVAEIGFQVSHCQQSPVPVPKAGVGHHECAYVILTQFGPGRLDCGQDVAEIRLTQGLD